MSKKNPLKQVWTDKILVDELKLIKAKRLINGIPVDNMAQLTRELTQCHSFPIIKEELSLFGKKKKGVRFDKKRGFF